MNEMQKTRDHVVGYFQAHPLVNTVTTLTPDLIDTNKDTIYPLVNVDLELESIDNDVIVFNANIYVLDQLDKYTRTTDNKLLTDTNSIDIDNEMFSVCQDFINSFRQYNTPGIELVGVSEVDTIRGESEYLNGLNGFTFTATLSIPNEGSACS